MQLTDGSSEVVDDVDGYSPEGALTTFFAVETGRPVRLDPWALRVLSLRTDRIARICRVASPGNCETVPMMSLVAG